MSYVIKHNGQYFFDNYLGDNHYTNSLDLAKKFSSIGFARIAKDRYDIRGKIKLANRSASYISSPVTYRRTRI